jgi:hypothetical protein
MLTRCAAVVAVALLGMSPVPTAVAVEKSLAADGSQTVVAYSFHGTLRCSTCLLVEQGADKVIRETFPNELNDGSLAWRSVNIRLPENRHFAADFHVESWALVLVDYRGEAAGKWKNLPLAGELVRADADAFRRYVTAEVRAFLGNPKLTTEDHE